VKESISYLQPFRLFIVRYPPVAASISIALVVASSVQPLRIADLL
jgi:hypothetical protein